MEILFKAKRADNGEWVIGYYVFRPDGKHLIYWKPFDEASQNTYHEVIPETVCLYSDLHDKNGNKISVGDIITSKDNPYKYYVVFEKGSFVCYHTNKALGKWGLLSRCFDADMKEVFGEIEITGNIYDNYGK